MSRDNRVPAYLSDTEDQQLSAFANEHDMSKAEVLRKAAMEYIDRDRAARLEDKIDAIDEKLDEALAGSENDTSHTHKANSASKTVQRARQIAQRVYDNHGEVVKAVDVKRAIEDVAGGDPRTRRKYESILKQRDLLYEHPSDSAVWTPNREMWCGWVESYVDATPSAEVPEVVEEYDTSVDEFDKVIAEA